MPSGTSALTAVNPIFWKSEKAWSKTSLVFPSRDQ